jgi:hypothetical protein
LVSLTVPALQPARRIHLLSQAGAGIGHGFTGVFQVTLVFIGHAV